MPRSTIEAVGSNARCGSAVLISKERSTTSVALADEDVDELRVVVAPHAPAAVARAAEARRTPFAAQRERKRCIGSLPGGGVRIRRAYFPALRSGRRLACSAGGAGGRPSTWSQHATVRPWATRVIAGSSAEQRSNAYGQRGWKRQPDGGRAGSGTSPGRASGRKPLPSGCGTAPISASV